MTVFKNQVSQCSKSVFIARKRSFIGFDILKAAIHQHPQRMFLLFAASAVILGCTSGDEGITCDEGMVICRNHCVNPMTSKRYCGADEMCENYQKCSNEQYCVKGVCSDEPDQTCPSGYLICGDECLNPDELNLSECNTCKKNYEDCNHDMSDGCEANLNTSRTDCGSCGNTCENGTSCYHGKCEIGCKSNELLCDNTCVNKQQNHLLYSCESCQIGYGNCNNDLKDGCEAEFISDPENCGVCGNTCPPGKECAKGLCKAACAETEKRCSGVCVNFSNVHMKSCTQCETNYLDCDKQMENGCEVYRLTDPNHCGICNHSCSAEQRCNKGICVSGCEPNETSCQVMGVFSCVDIKTDIYHCGGCNRYCKPEKNSIQLGCTSGKCSYECFQNKHNCGTSQKPICVDLQTDPENCGICFNQCNYPGVKQSICTNGKCSIDTCQENLLDCNGKLEDGCETNILSNPSHCGACNQKCSKAEFCNNGKCDSNCESPLLKCMKDELEVQCIDPRTDVQNCGECGHVCESHPHASAQCTDSTCTYICESGYLNCGTAESPICVDIKSDIANCGSCGTVCLTELPGTETAVCEQGECKALTCMKDNADCNKNPLDGCEVNLKTDAKSCGACNKVCEGDNAVCSEGECCIQACDNKECGSDGCGGTCGVCQYGECVSGKCVVDALMSGCSDGTREGFKNVNKYPQIAGCSGAWSVPGLHQPGPSCSRKSGNNGENASGTGCNVEDLCSEGWHVCLGKDDVKGRSVTGCSGIIDVDDAPYFFAARTSSSGSFNCTPDTVGSSTTNTDDFFGCGNMGCPAINESCTPLQFGSHDECIGIVDRSCTWTKDNNGVIKGSGAMACNWCKTLDYWNFVLKTDYKTAWNCGTSSTNEANNVIKTDPNSQGGVLCCKDQCSSDADCPEGTKCEFNVCK